MREAMSLSFGGGGWPHERQAVFRRLDDEERIRSTNMLLHSAPACIWTYRSPLQICTNLIETHYLLHESWQSGPMTAPGGFSLSFAGPARKARRVAIHDDAVKVQRHEIVGFDESGAIQTASAEVVEQQAPLVISAQPNTYR